MPADSTRDEVRRRCDSPIFRGGAFYPGAATVQPARLGRGLAERVRERGVEVFEHTPGASRRAAAAVMIVAEAHERGEVRARRRGARRRRRRWPGSRACAAG